MKYNKFKKELKKEFNENYTEEKKSAKLKTNFFAFLIPGLVVLAFAVIITVIVSLEIPKKIEAEQLNEKRAYYENLIDEKISSYESGQYYEMKKCDETTFNDYNKLQATLWTEGHFWRGGYYQPGDKIVEDGGLAPGAAEPAETETSYSTNNQEENVDEADIAKFDGKYCYYVTNYQFIIYDLNGNTLVRDDSRAYYNLQLYNDKIILYYYCKSQRYGYYGSKGVIYSFDGNNLQLLKEFYGDASTSRIYNNCLYNVGAINEDSSHDENVYYSSLDIDFNNFYYDELSDIVSVIKLSKIKLDDLSEKAVYTACSYGGYHNLYMSEDGIVIPTTIYSLYDKNYPYIEKEMTLNMVFDTNLNPVGIFTVSGRIDSKYWIDMYNNQLRVVSSSYHYGNINNVLTIFDFNKKEILAVLDENIGLPLENIYAVTYTENTCYIVTYRNTDPLYEIDISDPKNPVIVDALKVDGYSGYLKTFRVDGVEYIFGAGKIDGDYKYSIYINDDTNRQIGNDHILETYYSCCIEPLAMFFYQKDNILYFGAPTSPYYYVVYEIDVTKTGDEVIKEYKRFYTTSETRMFLYEGKLYLPQINKIIIEAFLNE